MKRSVAIIESSETVILIAVRLYAETQQGQWWRFNGAACRGCGFSWSPCLRNASRKKLERFFCSFCYYYFSFCYLGHWLLIQVASPSRSRYRELVNDSSIGTFLPAFQILVSNHSHPPQKKAEYPVIIICPSPPSKPLADRIMSVLAIIPIYWPSHRCPML